MVRHTHGHWASVLVLVLLVSLSGCEATQPKQVEDPDPLGLGAQSEEVSVEAADEPTADQTDEDAPGSEAPARALDGEPMGAEPEFTDSMSVNEAINAVPADSERLNIEQDVLAEPLQQAELYEPCKLGAGHFKARVAVWNGRAVGVDVETQPNNPKLAKCIDQQIPQVKWSEKVRSLNTVEYSY